MSSKRILGIAGAAMIGTLAGTGAVHAVIEVDGDGTITGVPTFAIETLPSNYTYKPSDNTEGGTTYYEVSDQTGVSNETSVRVPIGMEVPDNTNAVVTVNLTDLVMTGDAPSLVVSLAATDPAANIANLTTGVLTGGGRGDRQVQFSVTVGDVAGNGVTADHVLVVDFGGKLGVDPTKAGTISITTSRLFAGATVAETTTIREAIKTARALKVTVEPNSPVASVEEGFLKFKAGTGVSTNEDIAQLAAHVGRLEIGIATSTPPFENARRGMGEITGITDLVSAAKISFTGQTSFLEEDDDGDKLAYVGGAQCAPARNSIMNDDGDLEAALTDFDDATSHLCLKVDGETAIPETTAYEASIAYTSALGSNAAFPPAGSTHTLGSIERDGSTVNIVQLTTNRKYNQRIVLVNRTSGTVDYSTTFQVPDGAIEPVAKAAAKGELKPGRTVLEVKDMVVFDGGGGENNRRDDNGDPGGQGSAVLSVSIVPAMLEVATVTTRNTQSGGTGSTDTVVWEVK